jgi:integrase
VHAVDVEERDPRSTFREDVKRTLERWPNPNTRRKNRSILVSFYDWAMQELDPPRDNNPARQTRPPKARKPHVYRMTRAEVVAFLGAAANRRETRVAYLGVCAGTRNYELRHLQRRHFERPGWVHISADIAKVVANAGSRCWPSSRRSSQRSWPTSSRPNGTPSGGSGSASTWSPRSAGGTPAATPSGWTSSSSPPRARCSAQSS